MCIWLQSSCRQGSSSSSRGGGGGGCLIRFRIGTADSIDGAVDKFRRRSRATP